jgi:hypothetical protein
MVGVTLLWYFLNLNNKQTQVSEEGEGMGMREGREWP